MTFGNTEGERTLYQSVVAETARFQLSGTLEDWQREIAAETRWKSRWQSADSRNRHYLLTAAVDAKT